MDPLDPSHAEPFGEATGRFTRQKIAEIASLSALAGQFAGERRMRQAAKSRPGRAGRRSGPGGP